MAEKVDQRERAAHVWPVLVEHARAGKTLTVADIVARVGGVALGQRLPIEVIAKHCERNGLLPLTIVVVNADTKRPGPAFTGWPIEDFEAGFAKVCAYDWSSVKNPFELFATTRR